MARLQALNLFAIQTDLAEGELNPHSLMAACSLPHASHRILELHGCNETIYCKTCGKWSARKKLKGLAGYDTDAISAVPPDEYAKRFLLFLDQIKG